MQTPPSFSNVAAPVPPPPFRVRFDAIGDAWRLYMADVGQWIVAVLLVGLIAVVPVVIVQMVVMSMMVSGGGLFPASASSSSNLAQFHKANLVSTLVSVPFGLITQLLITGLQRRAVLQVRGMPAPLGEIFNLNGMGLSVLAFAAVSEVITVPWQLLTAYTNDPTSFEVFQPAYFGSLCGGGLVLVCLQVLFTFTPLVIVDQRKTLLPALKQTASTFGPQFFPLLGVLICTGVLAGIGVIACIIGVLFTAPVVYTLYGVVYNDFFRPAPVGPAESAEWYPRSS